jgi:hypothetical protein
MVDSAEISHVTKLTLRASLESLQKKMFAFKKQVLTRRAEVDVQQAIEVTLEPMT